MTILDFVLLAALAGFMIRGIFRGFLLELFDLIALVAGYIAARFLGGPFAAWLSEVTPIDTWVAVWISAAAVFVAAVVIVRLIAHLLKQIVHAALLGGLDRFLGAIFGLFKTALLALALLFIAMLSPWSSEVTGYAERGKISRFVVAGVMIIRDWLQVEPLPSTQSFATWMRSLGLDEETVHSVCDQPDLFREVVNYARRLRLDVPVPEFLQGDAATHLPHHVRLNGEEQRELEMTLADGTVPAGDKAKAFWDAVLTSSEFEE